MINTICICIWILCGVIGHCMSMAAYHKLVDNEERENLRYEIEKFGWHNHVSIMSIALNIIFGPVSLIYAVLCGHYKYGLKFWMDI